MAEKITTTQLLRDAVDAILEQDTFYETQPQLIHFGDTVLILAADRIILGTADVHEGEMRTYRYESVTVNGEQIVQRKYAITEQGWADQPEVTVYVKDAQFWERARW